MDPDEPGSPVRERHLEPAELAMLAAMGRGPDGRSTDVPSGTGAPQWVVRSIRFCSRCGTRLGSAIPETEQRERAVCSSCGHIAYVNPRLVVTTIPVTEDGEAVLIRRGIEPGYGAWAQPGGFLEVDETVAEAAVRETLEETGLLVEPGELVGLYSRLEAAVVVLAYEARIVGGVARETPETLEIGRFRPDAIPWDGIAFKTSFWALHDWAERRAPGVVLPTAFTGWEAD
ncbi:MAG: NUDIX hydrolase [Candidatus Limnocylindrales bacterium]